MSICRLFTSFWGSIRAKKGTASPHPAPTISPPSEQDADDLLFDCALNKMYMARQEYKNGAPESVFTDTMNTLSIAEQRTLVQRQSEAERRIDCSVYPVAYNGLARQHGRNAFQALFSRFEKIKANTRLEAEEQIEKALHDLGDRYPLNWTIDRRTSLTYLTHHPELETVGYALLGGNGLLISRDGSFLIYNATTHMTAHVFQTQAKEQQPMALTAFHQAVQDASAIAVTRYCSSD